MLNARLPFRTALLALAASLTLPATAPPAAAQDKVLRVALAGGTFGRAVYAALLAPFSGETGIAVEIVPGGDDPGATLQLQAAAGRIEFDLTVTDYQIIGSNLELIEDHGITLPNDLVVELPYPEKMVPNHLEAAYLVVCDRDAVAKCPTTFAEYFDDQAFPGDRSMPNVGQSDTVTIIENALLADGVAPDDLYPLDLDRAFAKLQGVRDSIRVFWSSFAQSQDIVRSGEAPINFMTDGRANQLVYNNGMNLSVSFKGAQGFSTNWIIPKNTSNAEAARTFLQWLVDNPDQQAVFTTLTFYGPPTRSGAEAAVKLGITDHTGLHTDELDFRDPAESREAAEWLEKNGEAMMERWNAFVSG